MALLSGELFGGGLFEGMAFGEEIVASSPYVGPMGRVRVGLEPLPEIHTRPFMVRETVYDEGLEMAELYEIYAIWLKSRH